MGMKTTRPKWEMSSFRSPVTLTSHFQDLFILFWVVGLRPWDSMCYVLHWCTRYLIIDWWLMREFVLHFWPILTTRSGGQWQEYSLNTHFWWRGTPEYPGQTHANIWGKCKFQGPGPARDSNPPQAIVLLFLSHKMQWPVKQTKDEEELS